MKKFTLFLFITILAFKTQVFGQEPAFEKGQLMVQLKNGYNKDEFIRTFEIETEMAVADFVLLSKTANIFLIRFRDPELDLNKAISRLYEYQAVNLVQKNHLIEVRETIPTDTLFSGQWFHKNTGQTGGTADADIDTPDAWDITSGGVTTHGDTIVACIIESSGVEINHVDLKSNIWHNYAEIPDNGIDDDNNGYTDDFDGWNVSMLNDNVAGGSHGTRVAGMIGASGNNITGVSGVNWNVKMMIVSSQVASNEASVIAAYDYPLTMRKMYNESYGQHGAFVVVTNASWGINNGSPADAPLWCAMYDTLGAYGILNVAATSNSNVNVDVVGDLPTTCPSQYLIAVTMTDHNDIRANSGYGPVNIDVGAPGNSVLLPTSANLYSSTSGTSFASPCVAGAVALTYSSPCAEFINDVKFDPSGTALQMKDYILNSVDPVANLSGEVSTGGRLNVKNAVDALMADCSVSACNAPYNVHDNQITDTTAAIVWSGFSTNYLVYIQEGSNPPVEIALTNQDTIFFDTLIPCTNYNVQVKGVCGSDTSDFSYGFNFTTDGCCENPPLIQGATSTDSITVLWNPVLYATSYDIQYKKQGDVTWIATYTDTVSPIVFDNLETCTMYEFQIKTICTDSTHGFSQSYFFSTLGCGSCYEAVYCEVIGANDNLEWIDSVVVNYVISKTGANNGWYQSSAVLTGFEAGMSYPVVLKPGYSGTAFTEKFSIWIDVDQNGIFDVTDKVLSNASTTSVLSANITIPSAALTGITKMRIGMNGTDNPEECPSSSFFGEYEDYCVYIGPDAGFNEDDNKVSIYPNPASSLLHILSDSPLEEIRIFTYDGKLVLTEKSVENVIDISGLVTGIYILQIQTNKGSSTQKFIRE